MVLSRESLAAAIVGNLKEVLLLNRHSIGYLRRLSAGTACPGFNNINIRAGSTLGNHRKVVTNEAR
jgi:hypothetical protein